MEGPIDFDIWCNFEKSELKKASMWTAKLFSISIVDAYKLVSDSFHHYGYIQIFEGIGWDDAPRLKQELPDFVQKDSCIVTESSYRPSDCSGYCERHLLWYTTPTCPVCEGTYISRVVNGMRFASHEK